MKEEEKYIKRCIQLAKNGIYNAPPNPMVGAVIVCDGRIIGEGYHARCGEAHAEVNAIRSVKETALLRRSTIYVSLEPCSHYGKTPPCADLIIEKGIPRIVIGCQDPFPEVAGRGIKKLRDAGREVIVGVCEEECRALIGRFVTFHTRKRPYITLKWAESADGYMDRKREDGTPFIFSTPLTSLVAHKRRAEHSAILVGTRTALLDNPTLTDRHWAGHSPVRLVIDRELRLPPSLHLFDGSTPTVVFTEAARPPVPGVGFVQFDFSRDIVCQILSYLHKKGLQSVLVEGGSRLLQSFIDASLWDEIHVEESPVLLKEGVASPQLPPAIPFDEEWVFGHRFRHYTAAKNRQTT